MRISHLQLVCKVQSLKNVDVVDFRKVSQILAVRQQAIGELVGCARRYIRKYGDPSRTVCTHKVELCDTTSFGAIARAFNRIGIYPLYSEATSLKNKSLRDTKSLIDGVFTINSEGLYFEKPAQTACCNNPWPRHSWCPRSVQVSETCRQSARHCLNCDGPYKEAGDTVHSHLSCIPLLAIKAEMDGIVDKVTGLQYYDFFPHTTENTPTMTTHPSPDAKDWWDSLVFQ